MLVVSLLRDFAVPSAALCAAKSSEEPRSLGDGELQVKQQDFIHLEEKVRHGDVTFHAG